MTTNEELVAAASEHLAHNVWDDEIFVLADRLVTALEAVTTERDELLSAEELAAEDRGKLIEERDGLAAVVKQVRERLERPIHPYGEKRIPVMPEKVFLADAYGEDLVKDFENILNSAPSVALDRVKAEALRDAADYLDSFEGPGGRQSAHDRAGRDIIRLIRDRADHIEKGESNE